MANTFYNFLNPAGSTYAPKMKVYKELKEMSKAELINYLETNFTHANLMNLLADYMHEEFHAETEKTQKIRITEEQFEKYFSIIKPYGARNVIKKEGEVELKTKD